ncbi:MAG: Rrf2 family transcriptional regulator [Oscillospiraceae bacterium]
MNLTLESDYAVRIVSCLAADGKRMDAKAIAEKTCVSLRFSLKILRKLVNAGFITSFKGTQGGYTIAKSPFDITLCDVIEAIEGKYVFSRCLESAENPCSRGMSGMCCYQNAFREITYMVREKLLEYNFGELLLKQDKLLEELRHTSPALVQK